MCRPSGSPTSRAPPRSLPDVDPRWDVRRERVAPAEAFARPWPDPSRPTAWVVELTRPALVLGSTQPWSLARPDAAGAEVVRRRSGGGAVLVEPGRLVWVDVFVPAGDRLWDADVGRAFAWLGRAWAGALADVGVGPAVVHAGSPVRTTWSRAVCFAGLGPGEVTVGGAKVVGICQRRARAGALFQCAALVAWDPARLLALLDLPDEDLRQAETELAGLAAPIDADPAALAATLLARLP